MISQFRTGSTDFYPQLYTQQLQAVAAHFLIQLPDRDVDHDVGLVTNGPRAGVWKVYTRKKTKRTVA
jgi:hypothetical protein